MTIDEQLQKVKNALGIAGTYQDETLKIYIEEVKQFIIAAGVSENTANSEKATGIICRGVTDLWNYGAGSAELSSYFKMRVSQLVLSEVKTNDN